MGSVDCYNRQINWFQWTNQAKENNTGILFPIEFNQAITLVALIINNKVNSKYTSTIHGSILSNTTYWIQAGTTIGNDTFYIISLGL